MESFTWRSESDARAPVKLSPVDDRLKADVALARLRRRETLLYTGDWNNARQLLTALGKRLSRPSRAKSALEAFREERRNKHREHAILSGVVVALDREYRLSLSRAPDVALACRQVWGEPEQDWTVVPLKTLLGMLGAAEWRRKGLAVPGLKGMLQPHYGVYTPTRTDYVEVLAGLEGVEGKRVIEVGTGTGVLSFLLLQRGAREAVATDLDPRAVTCARENAALLGLDDRFRVLETDLFPEGTADLVICNPPWIPEPPKTRVDRAVFDEDSQMLTCFLRGLSGHLTPGGEGLLILSDLAVRLGLRPEGWLEQEIAGAGLTIAWTRTAQAKHGKAHDRTDPLHAVRSLEVTTLYGLRRA
jgi:SAM-dependent methyltransferase